MIICETGDTIRGQRNLFSFFRFNHFLLLIFIISIVSCPHGHGKEIMTYQAFQNHIKEQIAAAFSEETKVEIREVIKNNGVSRTGLTVFPPGSSISLSVYLEEYYERYKRGEDIEKLSDEIRDMFAAPESVPLPDVSTFRYEKKVREKVVCRLIGRKNNERLLKRVPHRSFLDLAIVYECILSRDNERIASVLITREHQKLLHLSAGELHKAAVQNTYRLSPPEFLPMREMISSMLAAGREHEAVPDAGADPDDCPALYVLTNSGRYHGAFWMTEKKLLNQIGKTLGHSFYILPSSIHEVMILADLKCFEAEELQKLVREVNRYHVAPEEVLTDTVYYYDISEGSLGCASDMEKT